MHVAIDLGLECVERRKRFTSSAIIKWPVLVSLICSVAESRTSRPKARG